MNPFDLWMGMWRSGQAAADTALTLGETLRAAGAVVDSRSRTMAAASRDPINGDYAELARMVPEKLAAFSAAGASALRDLQAVQSYAMANWRLVTDIAFKGRIATAKEANAIATRSAAMVERTARAGGKALAPVHRAATGNARRLKRSAAKR